jgi:quinol monooxygenase YgiN
MLVVTGRTAIKAASMPQLLKAASQMTAETLAEAGCAKYHLAIDVDDPLVVHLFEQWESSEALDTHFATPHFQSFGEVLLGATDRPAEFTRYEVSSVAPLFG